jgi:O-antigen ligase
MSRRATQRPRAVPSKPTPKPPRSPGLVLLGVVIAVFGSAVSMLPGGHNPFGPIKALVVLCGSALIATGLALSPHVMLAALRRMTRARGVWAGLALVGVAALATITSLSPLRSLFGLYPEYQGFVLLICAAFAGFGAFSLAAEGRTWKALGRAAVVAILIVAAYALLQFAGLDPVPYEREFAVRRVRSALGNASNLGVFLCLALPLAVARARAELGTWRWLAWASSAAGAFTLLWSLSRGAWLGAIAGALVWLLAEHGHQQPGQGRRFGALAAGALLACALAVAFLNPLVGDRLGTLLDSGSGTGRWRVEVWSATADLVGERPVLGFGPAMFRYAFPPRRTASMMDGETGTQALDDPHNLFASAAVSAGVAGLLVLLWLLGEALLAAWQRHGAASDEHLREALLSALVAGVVALQFHFVTLDSAPLLAAIIGLAVGRAAVATASQAAPAKGALGARLARATAAAAALTLTLGCVAAAGLVLADRNLARGFTLVAEKSTWERVREPMAAAGTIAPWEPAMQWAAGRAATQWMSATQQTSAFADGREAMSATLRRLPLDPLAAAQNTDFYLVYGLAAKDRSALEQALASAVHASAMDPQNGYRWEAKGTAIAALGDTEGAVEAYMRAVKYAPGDAQAWSNLARMYERLNERSLALDAQRHADALTSTSAEHQ